VRLLHEEYEHPTQVGRVGLSVFEQPGEGFLVTEERGGTATVVKTIGLFERREPALERVRERERELQAQRFTKVAPAA
jgi:hypothetical protein